MNEYKLLEMQHALMKDENRRREHKLLFEAIDSLTAERDALKADAERLDWLQKTRGTVFVCNHIEYVPRTDGSNLRNEVQVFDGWCADINLDAVMDVRAAIDAAMKRGEA